jgi:hypothetical protein
MLVVSLGCSVVWLVFLLGAMGEVEAWPNGPSAGRYCSDRPRAVLIDAAGQVFRTYIGYTDKAVIEPDVRALLGLE